MVAQKFDTSGPVIGAPHLLLPPTEPPAGVRSHPRSSDIEPQSTAPESMTDLAFVDVSLRIYADYSFRRRAACIAAVSRDDDQPSARGQ